MRRVLLLIGLVLVFLAGRGWARGGRVALFVNLERLPGFEVKLEIEEVLLEGEKGVHSLGLISRELSTETSFGQELIALGEVPAGRYTELKLIMKKARVKGQATEVVHRVRYPVSFELRNGDTISLFLVWDVAASLSGKRVVPRMSVRPQERPLPGENLFVGTEDTSTLWVISTDVNRVVYSVGVGKVPRGLAFDAARGRVYVVCEGEREIRVVGVRSFRVEDVIPVPLMNSPRYLAVGPEGTVFLSSPSDRLVELVDLERGALLSYRRVPYEPGEVIYLGNLARYAVSAPADSAVYFFDQELNPAGRITAGFRPRGLAADDRFFYVADENGGLHIFTLPDLSPRGRVDTCFRPVRVLAVDGRVFVSCEDGNLDVLLAGHRTISRRIRLGKPAFSMVYYSPRRWLYVALREAGAVAVVDFNREKLMGTLPVGGRPFEMVVDHP